MHTGIDILANAVFILGLPLSVPLFIVTPKHGPILTGGRPRYSSEDTVRMNCTSGPSKPACHLSWLINGIHVNRTFLRQYDPVIVGRDGLEVARVGLEFRVRRKYFKHSDMKVKLFLVTSIAGTRCGALLETTTAEILLRALLSSLVYAF
ncbi:PREDICTED: uncharacterized protein LOC108363863 [Rhagoletis zephyria]|uniref:uncharacterized protein LOC108363863 n=1 Tax=Rhagoletis zephyria TaxID=28612 RepID=UPI00081159F3|nr:PREDICTED: uncharacterized protein LOC108363863 [Rhagoletis zephyria]